MKFQSSDSTVRPQGYALIITLFFLGVMLLVFAGMLSWTTTNAALTERNNLYNESQMAAESATECALASMIKDFHYNNYTLQAASIYSAIIPNTNGWPIPYTFSDSNGVAGQITVAQGSNGWATVGGSQLAGWGSFYTITAQATPVGQRYSPTARITQSVWFGTIPLFQYAIFYNMDMEINPGAQMTVYGKVHSNQKLYTTGNGGSQPLTYSSYVDGSQGVIFHRDGPADPSTQRTNGNVFLTTGQPISGANTVNLPVGNSTNNNPTNVLSLLNPPPSAYSPNNNNSSAYTTNGLQYFANAADLIISNGSAGLSGTGGTNISVYYQDPNQSHTLTLLPGDVTNSVTGGTSYSFVTNGSYYDYREAATVQSIDIDVGKLNTWLTTGAGSTNSVVSQGTANKTHIVDSIYAINSVVPTVRTNVGGGNLPAVRVLDAQMLPTNGLTVVTPDPIYVKGNYNVTTNGVNFSTALGDTTNTRPAALMGDSITLLSSMWTDALETPSYPLASRIPVNTTLNAATLEGIVPSNTNYYSGGTENFLRLLENWTTSTTLSYNGSIVVMFPSQIATNGWNSHANVYGVPTRAWGFDLNFTKNGGLPPLTPQAYSVVRTSWNGQ